MLREIFWRNKIGLSLGFCLSFSLINILWQSNFLSQGVGIIGGISDRVSGALNSGLRFTGTLWVELGKYRQLEKRYSMVKKRLAEYRLEKDKFDHLIRENKELRDLVGFKPQSEYPEILAEVLGIRLNSISPRIIIDKGKKEGINRYMPVLARAYDNNNNLIRAVVGIVITAGDYTATVQPITHYSFKMAVRLPEIGQWAILSGNSGKMTESLLTYISSDASSDRATITFSDAAPVKDIGVYSSGAGGVFPRGIPVGTVLREGPSDGEFKTAYVKPFAAIHKLNHVIVIQKKPSQWTQKSEQNEEWEEHLITQFGKVEYPETKRKVRKKIGLKKIKPKENENPSAAKIEMPEKKPLKPDTAEPRKLQNLRGP